MKILLKVIFLENLFYLQGLQLVKFARNVSFVLIILKGIVKLTFKLLLWSAQI